MFMEQAAERAETLEADFETNVSYGKATRRQQLFRLLYAPLSEVLMRSLVERAAKESQEVIPRQACFAGDLFEVQRQMVTLVDEPPGADESLVGIRGDG